MMDTAAAIPPRQVRPIQAVADYLGVHEQTVRALIKRGELGSFKIGRRTFVTDDQLAEFISAHTIDPTT